ncbi:NUDIX domain-containing protein [Nocardia sp. NPDC048505]|uniref:NUDIX hydrolase n=1 Tax=unclassified Nocardia TaxID=2637762 RepID=UPI0033FB15C2
MSFRIAAYGVCLEQGRVLLVRDVAPDGEGTWTLPGGRVEHTEDPFDAVIRELREETGHDGVVDRLLGVDSRVIPAAVAHGGVAHQNIGIFYRLRITGGRLRAEPDGSTIDPTWTPLGEVGALRRSALVDTGLTLARTLPPTGHVAATPVGGLVQH